MVKNKTIGIMLVLLLFSTTTVAYSQQVRPITLSPELSAPQKAQPTAQQNNSSSVQNVQRQGNIQTITVKPTTATNAPAELPSMQNPVTETKLEPYYTNWDSMEAYNKINVIGDKLLSANNIRGTISFSVVNTEVVNATTNLNNEVKIYKGLLKYVEQEDELAAVIGHELGHVKNDDVKQMVGRNYLTQGIRTAGRLMESYGGNGTLRTIGTITKVGTDVGGDMVNKKIGRNDEFAADKASVDLLVKAGYNPLAEISILNKISGNYFDLMSDHPSGERRILAIYQYVQQTYPEYIKQGYPTVSYQRALKIINRSIAYKQ